MEILANILASEISGRTVKEATPTVFVIGELLVGFSLVAAGYYLPLRWSLPVTFFGAPGVAIGLNVLLFAAWRYYLSFMPVVLGVVVHAPGRARTRTSPTYQGYSRLEGRNAKLEAELDKLRRIAEPTTLRMCQHLES